MTACSPASRTIGIQIKKAQVFRCVRIRKLRITEIADKCGFKENSRRHPLSRLSRGFDDEAAYSSISGFKVSYLDTPLFVFPFTLITVGLHATPYAAPFPLFSGESYGSRKIPTMPLKAPSLWAMKAISP